MNAKNVSSIILFYKRNEIFLFYSFLFTYKSMQDEKVKDMNARNVSSVILIYKRNEIFLIFIFFYLFIRVCKMNAKTANSRTKKMWNTHGDLAGICFYSLLGDELSNDNFSTLI